MFFLSQTTVLGAYLIADGFFGVYAMCVDTFFLCFCEYGTSAGKYSPSPVSFSHGSSRRCRSPDPRLTPCHLDVRLPITVQGSEHTRASVFSDGGKQRTRAKNSAIAFLAGKDKARSRCLASATATVPFKMRFGSLRLELCPHPFFSLSRSPSSSISSPRFPFREQIR